MGLFADYDVPCEETIPEKEVHQNCESLFFYDTKTTVSCGNEDEGDNPELNAETFGEDYVTKCFREPMKSPGLAPLNRTITPGNSDCEDNYDDDEEDAIMEFLRRKKMGCMSETFCDTESTFICQSVDRHAQPKPLQRLPLVHLNPEARPFQPQIKRYTADCLLALDPYRSTKCAEQAQSEELDSEGCSKCGYSHELNACPVDEEANLVRLGHVCSDLYCKCCYLPGNYEQWYWWCYQPYPVVYGSPFI